ncbi:alpha/beta fold hydrolase [Thermoleophilum album]|uniref:Pimeloyl-ACP methyl ester carboxylesterase n=1 Tax=Thermoleophilum album TaxID=29539 RepID=A0A1H6FLF1_THEAL|nr:alpha/beta fold hydrolase [Thermoleophilum album]SEH10958.1 Pimeloyl-ACP methyl ester carboxylesterase [Thermoleophilum album]
MKSLAEGGRRRSKEARAHSFVHEGHRLVYDEYGSGPRHVLLLPGLLFPRWLNDPLATALAAQGFHVYTLDLLGHGESDRPREMWAYSMTRFGSQAIALLDHVGAEQAVVGGPSLGANTTLEAAALAPERIRGMVISMPVLDNALLACALAFTPLLVALTFGAPAMRGLAAVARRVPRGLSHLTDTGLDWLSQDPKPSASLLQGLFYGRIAPPHEMWHELRQPALVIGHPRDPIHPFSDADQLVRELPNARLVRSGWILELWTSPERLTGEIARFAADCWRGVGAGSTRRTRRRPATVRTRRTRSASSN